MLLCLFMGSPRCIACIGGFIPKLSFNYIITIFYLSYNGRQRAILGMVRGAAPKEPKLKGRSYAIPFAGGPASDEAHPQAFCLEN